jgi:hypothetical protein
MFSLLNKLNLKCSLLIILMLFLLKLNALQESQLNLRVANEIASISSTLNDQLIKAYLNLLKHKFESNSLSQADKRVMEYLIRHVQTRQKDQEDGYEEVAEKEKPKSGYMHWRHGR